MNVLEACEILKCNRSELAKKLGVTRSLISMWGNDDIPVVREYQIRDLLEGRIPLQEKRKLRNTCEIDQ